MDCPVCEKRIKQGLADCEQEKKELQAKNQRLVIAVTIGLTLMGREAAAVLYDMLNVVEQVVSVDAKPEKPAFLPSPRSRDMTLLTVTPSQPLFPNVPPLLPSLREPDYLAEITVLPDPNPMMMYGWALIPTRKRKP